MSDSKKVYPDATSALDGLLSDGMTILAGGFGEEPRDATGPSKEVRPATRTDRSLRDWYTVAIA